jgi:6-phosphogluconate dehydrogenase
MAESAEIAVIGLGVMGRSLALNMRDREIAVLGFDADEAARTAARAEGLAVADNLAELLGALTTPRLVLLMVPAGTPVDGLLDVLLPCLSPGDVVADGGNSYWLDTIRRARLCAESSIEFLGVGISGGEEGARHGPAIMAGGSPAAWLRAGDLLQKIAATSPDGPCCALVGPGGAGHFVKMVHNGIEYAVMQLIAETHAGMDRLLGLESAAMADLFASWQSGELASYLTEITARILREPDLETGRPLVELIADTAEQKGTGAWASIAAIELGVPAPTLLEAAQARSLSALKELRTELARMRPVADGSSLRAVAPGRLRGALLTAELAAYSQGFLLMRVASTEQLWGLDLCRIAGIWQSGCIIRARLLERVVRAYRSDASIPTLLHDPGLRSLIQDHLSSLRRVVAAAAEAGLAMPAHASALAWLDGITSERSSANLIQAQRDFFGAHQFQRIDRPGRFHHLWNRT